MALAKAINAKVTAVTVSPPFHTLAIEPSGVAAFGQDDYERNCEVVASKRLDRVRDAAAAAGIVCDVVHVESDHPYEAIIATAGKNGCDVIVMASHGRRGMSAVVLGSETVKVLTHSQIPVLVCR